MYRGCLELVLYRQGKWIGGRHSATRARPDVARAPGELPYNAEVKDSLEDCFHSVAWPLGLLISHGLRALKPSYAGPASTEDQQFKRRGQVEEGYATPEK